MAGMKGFEHKCESRKINYEKYKQTLRDSSFTRKQVAMIWDFYVSRSFAGENGQSIGIDFYGWTNDNKKETGLNALEEKLMDTAGIKKMCCIRSTTIKDTLVACDLSSENICVEHPRIVLQQLYSLSYNENEEVKINSNESRITALFRHIRNAFAHSNTYFINDEYVLLEDKNGKTITAKILLKKQTLIDWIFVVDKNQQIYHKDELDEG